jgi:Flp pilus assembly protein TadD
MLPSSNDIKNLTIPWLFQDIRKARKTGTGVFEQGEAMIKVFFRQGDVIFASSNIDDDAMAEFMLRTGRITQAQLDKSAAIMARTNKKFGTVLFEMGVITPQDLVAQVKLQEKQNVLVLFSWREGQCRFEDGLLPGAEIVPLQMDTGELIIEGVRGLDWQEIRQSLPPPNTVVRRVIDPAPLFSSTQLNQEEHRVLSLINSKVSIQKLCDLSGIGDLKTLTALYTLLALRVVEEGAREAPAAVEQTPAETKTAGEVLLTREMLQNAYDSLAIQNYYEILGVGHGATPQEIKTAYFALARLYHPDRYANTELTDMKEKLETLMINLSEAYGVLNVKAKRDQYNLDLASGTKKYQKEAQTSAESEEANKVSAAAQFDEGMKQYRVQNFWGAEEAFRWAVRLDPSKPEYVFYQGVALAHLPRRRHEAEEFFIKAINMSSSKVEYYLELGNYYAKNGLRAKAMVVYEKALKRYPTSEKIKQAIKKIGG